MKGAFREIFANRWAKAIGNGARSGLRIGIATGLVTALVDAIYALQNPFSGSARALVFSIVALLVPSFAAAGALLGGYLGPFAQRARERERFRSSVVTSSLAALPLLAFALWVPSSWIGEHWDELAPRDRSLTVVAMVAVAGGVLVLARSFYAAARRWENRRVHRLLALAAIVLLGAAAAATYWADAVLYEGDYDDFHYGLAVVFSGLVALLVVVIRAVVARAPREPRPESRFRRLLAWGVPALLVLSFVAVARMSAVSFGRSKALVFGKLVGTARSVADVDGDGYASILGGGDCAAFDARFSPGQLEVPENGVDDDCSGSDAEWPVPPPRPALANPPPRWNVLLVSIDALRADHVGAYGYRRDTTPNIDRLAKRSLVYTEAYSQAPKTSDSVPSIFTGSYPSNIQREAEQARRSWAYSLTAEAQPLPVLLRARGYATGAGVGFHLRQLETGFDTFEMKEPTETARRFLETATTPFFLWLHYPEPHIPYARHREHDFGSSPIDRYDGEIAQADAEFGKVIEMLAAKKVLDSTVVIVTADHGEEFGEHGGTSHTRKLYRELLHVPLVLSVPGMRPRRIGEVVELVDIVPTLCELLGLKTREGEQDGQSLLGERRGRRLRGAYAEDVRQPYNVVFKRALFDGRFRFIDDRQNDRQELYDDKRDRLEQREIGHERPDVLKALREALSVRPLRRHTETFRKLSSATDAQTWAELMPTIRRSEMIDLALDRFPRSRSPAHDAVLQALLARPDLTPQNRDKASRLLAAP